MDWFITDRQTVYEQVVIIMRFVTDLLTVYRNSDSVDWFYSQVIRS